MARVEDKRNAYRVLVGNPERRRPVGKSRCTWEDNIKMDLILVTNGGLLSMQ